VVWDKGLWCLAFDNMLGSVTTGWLRVCDQIRRNGSSHYGAVVLAILLHLTCCTTVVLSTDDPTHMSTAACMVPLLCTADLRCRSSSCGCCCSSSST
jgi:hypothetical protein